MMDQLFQTVKDSLQELVASGVKLIPAILMALVILFLTRYAAQFVQKIVEQVSSKTIRSQSLQLLVSKVSHIGVWTGGVLFACIITFPGLSLGDIIATLGLTSVAIGFAFQDIFKNFLAGILLLVQEPFQINDQVIIGEYEGTVEQIDIRTTQIRNYQGERILIPNANVFTSAVQVRTAFASRRTDLAVGVDYNTPLRQASQLLERTISQVEGVLESPEIEIDLVSFGDSSIDFLVRYWTRPQQKIVRRVQTRAIVAIKEAFDRADINIPYPIRTLYFYNQDQYNDYIPSANSDNRSEDGVRL
ncbi:mechanosensitive ion channel family protein [Capilliphycus salinus ALCB114379]|uniref:mechanosensitive ion channel family protein n=1 Tax=Capilliphycus salinus TaxID=2768948 RepID=UPI0039A6B1DC